ncbi:MAG: lysine--tRNA ligase [Polyangiaceae bacterium]|nr:lysine--tRNA ligase [Polyangiaceae bacterium]
MNEPRDKQQAGAGAGAEPRPDEALIAVRKHKAATVRARGDNPFANDVGRDPALVALAEVRAHAAPARGPDGRYAADAVPAGRFRVAGRILFLRGMGGVTFVRLRDRTGELQLYCDEAVLGAAYARLEELDLGDFVEAVGTATATKKGELSIQAESFRLLSKAYRPLPTKTSFRDVEARYRMRYVDLVANPPVASVFRARSTIVSALRSFLDARGYLEVETPTMHTVIGGAAAKPFVTHHNALDLRLYMRIAPELYLKRLLVGGFERVYEVARCYRNEGLSTRHNPEFTMLEFYQAYATYETLMDLTEELLRAVDAELARRMPEEHPAWLAARPFTLGRFARVTMRQAVATGLERAGMPVEASTDAGRADAPIGPWAKAAKQRGRAIDWDNYRAGMRKCDNDGERLFCAYEYLAEPFLAEDYREGAQSVPVFVTEYPAEVSPLARKSDTDGRFVDRFELFVHGRELCNAFSELNDPEDQAARFLAQLDKRARGAEETMDYDADYIRALEHGMPPAAGFGMGVDRLAMMLTGAASIRDVILFPLLRPEATDAL